MKQNLMKLKEKIDDSIIIVENFSTSLSIMGKLTTPKITKDT